MTEAEYQFDPELEEEKEQSEEDDMEVSPPLDIVAFNELRSCAELLRMAEKGQMIFDPEFQRNYVWKPNDQARFIDSLVKGLPIPSLCISFDFDKNERYVIDGRQRIQTIINFLSNPTYRIAKIKDIDIRIAGKLSNDIKNNSDKEISKLYDRVESLTIPVTVIRCNYSNIAHMQYLFMIFHRLNSGGSKLNNQEIRNCIYMGMFNKLLKSCADYAAYKTMMDIQPKKEYRFAYEEMNLRFFALYEKLDKYTGRLATYLNDYMFEKFTIERNEAVEKKKGNEVKNGLEDYVQKMTKLFCDTVDLIFEKILDKRPISHLSKAFIDALFVGVASNINDLKVLDSATIKEYYKRLHDDENFSTQKLKEGVAQKQKVIDRITMAKMIFGGK